MLQYIFGTAKSGKTTYILEKIKELSSKNNKSVIIVPEQASFETEKQIFKLLGDSFSLNVEVLSFSRLYDQVCRIIGGTAARNLNDCDKIIFMNKTLKAVASDLKLWSKYANSLTFAQKMLDSIGEFKINGITAKEISAIAENVTTPSLNAKLMDLALIYETYDLFTAERFIDPADKLTLLYNKLEYCNYFADKTVFFDGFKGFTGQQFKIIDRIFSSAENIYFAFTEKITNINEYDIFSNIRTAINKIDRIAEKHSLTVLKPIILNQSYYNTKSLNSLEKLISGEKPLGDCNDSVTVCTAKTVFDEAEFCARTIRRLVRSENYRYRDFAIITRDSKKYTQAVQYACQKNNVNCFFDQKIPLLMFPLSVSVLSAVKALDFSTENILRFHKSGIDLLTTDEICELENYTYIWKIDGELWLKEWDMDFRGFVTDQQNDDQLLSLKKINQLRIRAIAPILNFKDNFCGNVKHLSKAIIKLLDDCDISKSLSNLCERFSDDSYSCDAIKQSYDAFMNVLDSIVTCYNDQTMSPNEYYDALYLSLSLEQVGLIPQTLDQVIFGQADRIRPSNPKVVFILGANQGIFPKFTENNSIFAIKERKKLIELGLEINDNELFSSIDEKFLVYSNLCAAREKLYISYSLSTLDGQILEPSSFLTEILDTLNPKIAFEPSEKLEINALPETQKSAFSELCRRIGDKGSFITLKTVLEQNEYPNLSIFKNLSNRDFSINSITAKNLYGNNFSMSATKFDTFHRCRFSHFCKYGLKLKKLQTADFDVLQRGTIVHFVLEKIISEYKENIKDLSQKELDTLCDKYIDLYLDSVKGYRTVETARHKFIISKISRSLKEVVYHISKEFAQSDFKPVACELAIGGKEGIPLKFPFKDGEINLIGSIDRVDTYNGYIRIVDYKTGTKSFKLPDILFGLNLQMLIYLYAITRGQNLSDQSAAGIFYMPAKRDLNNNGMAMNGLLIGDIDLVCAMEKENRGEFVPKLSLTKDGSISKSASSFVSSDNFTEIFDYIEKLMQTTGESIISGDIKANPIDGRESAACAYCDYKAICGIDENTVLKVPDLKNAEVFEILKKEKNDGI